MLVEEGDEFGEELLVCDAGDEGVGEVDAVGVGGEGPYLGEEVGGAEFEVAGAHGEEDGDGVFLRDGGAVDDVVDVGG